MAKKIQGYIRLQLPAGAANPAPPVGPALGAQGVNIMAFCKEFNARTKDQNGMILPVVITVFSDKSFTFILKSPPASVLLKKAANIASGSARPNQDKVGKVTKKQLLEIYNLKKADLNAREPIYGQVEKVLQSFSVLITLSSPGPAPKGLGSTGISVFNGLWTYLGVPCVSLPLMRIGGMPCGVQLIGLRRDEGRLLAAAQWLERNVRAVEQ